MLAGVKPQVVIDMLKEQSKKQGKKDWAWRGTTTKQLVWALRKLGVQCKSKVERMCFDSILPPLCIAKLHFGKATRPTHWIVVDSRKMPPKYLDPWYGNEKKWPPHTRITSALEILTRR